MGNLPVEASTFVGRRQELDNLKGLLGESRLVTLVGPGGTGKTRLACRAGAELRRAFPAGVWFVDLTSLPATERLIVEVNDPDMVAYSIMVTLGVQDQPGDGSPTDQVVGYLAGRQALLVLDNCEHLLPACAALAYRLLRACPRLRVLATSREPLRLPGEVVCAVAPLQVPAPEAGRAELAGCDAVALFLARAQSVQSRFALTENNQAAIAQLCRRLDGVPLAIELAAARVRVLAPGQILDRLNDRFGLLSRGHRTAPARQQTLRACVDWSFELCSKPERLLWARVSVFAGGCDLDAIEAVCADELLPAAEMLDVVAGLVDKSILVRDVADVSGQQARYRMLETLREYGQDQLTWMRESEQLCQRQRDWCQRLVERARQEWISPRQGYWMGQLRREHPNLRAAVESFLAEAGPAEGVLRLTVTVPIGYWGGWGLHREVRDWLKRAMVPTTAPTAWQVAAQILGGFFAYQQGELEAAKRLLERAEPLARQLGAKTELARAAWLRGLISTGEGSTQHAVESLNQGLAILAQLPQPDLHTHLHLLVALGIVAALGGDLDRAEVAYEQALAITEPRGEAYFRSCALWISGQVAWRRGELGQATADTQECLRLRAYVLNNRLDVAITLEVLAWITASQQHQHRAATLLGAADARRADLGLSISKQPRLLDGHQQCAARARDALGEVAFRAAFAHGQGLAFDEAITYALDERPQPAPSLIPAAPTPLTRREQQVAQLVGQGLSNREIASTLVISPRTAESHVEHILDKLGLANRTQIAAWLATHARRPAQTKSTDQPHPA